jgi:hypothetical protein
MNAHGLGARPIRHAVDGSPYQPGQGVAVVRSVEEPGYGIDIVAFIGLRGVVEYLEYSCGCGQRYPEDPMIGVRLDGGALQEFWSEELQESTGRRAVG